MYYEHENDDYDHLKAIHDGVESVNTSGWGGSEESISGMDY